MYHQGNVSHSLKLLDDFLQLIPHHIGALEKKAYCQEIIKLASNSKSLDDDHIPTDIWTTFAVVSQTPPAKTERQMYESLCRGQKRMSAKLESQLDCHYLNTQK